MKPALYILTVLGIGIGAYLVGTQGYKISINKEVAPTTSATQTPTASSLPTTKIKVTGTIEGSLSYPSHEIPKEIQICAETLDESQATCTNVHIKGQQYTYGVGYKLEVEEGEYYVYSQLGDYKAYYNEFVTCGLMASCPSHEKIKVIVKAGATTSKIDPQDWYDN